MARLGGDVVATRVAAGLFIDSTSCVQRHGRIEALRHSTRTTTMTLLGSWELSEGGIERRRATMGRY